MNNNRGSILIISYVVVVVLTILGAALVMRSTAENRIAQRYVGSQQALWLAEAGMQKGMWELDSNNCAGFAQCETATPCTDCNCAGVTKCLAGTLETSGDYDVTVNNGNTEISSTGSFPGRSSPNRLQRGVKADIKQGTLFSRYALFGSSSVRMGDYVVVDSYDSSLGDYGGSNIGENANVGSNCTTTQIRLGDYCIIKGDASTGPGGAIRMGTGAEITGTITHNNNTTLPPIVVPDDLVNLPGGEHYNVANGGTKTLTGGNYQYTWMRIRVGGQLNITGNVRIYLTAASTSNFGLYTDTGSKLTIAPGGSLTIYTEGDTRFAGTSIINTNKDPSAFTLYSKSPNLYYYPLEIVDDAQAYGQFYAPNGTIQLHHTPRLYGSVIAKKVVLTGHGIGVLGVPALHYDEHLRNGTPGGGSGELYSMYNWREFLP